MNSRRRVQASFEQRQPDFTPCDYFSTPEIQQELQGHFGVKTDSETRQRLGTDIRYMNPTYLGPASAKFDDAYIAGYADRKYSGYLAGGG